MLNRKLDTNNSDRKICLALMSSFIILTIQYFILIYFNLLYTTSSVIQLISKILVGASFLYAFPSVWIRSKIKFLLIYFIAIFIFLLNYIVYPENREYLHEIIVPLFFMCIPAFIYSISIEDWRVFKIIMQKASIIVFIFGSILGILILTERVSSGSYSMSLSYYMLLPTIVFLNELLERFSLKSIVLFLISIGIILTLGSRGAILCVVLFIILKLFRNVVTTSYTKAFQNLFIIGTIIIISLQLNKIITFINEKMLSFGIESRTLRLLLSNEVSLSGRDNIYKNVIDAIVKNPFSGIGLAADRRLTNTGYVHNFYLEVLANFGVIIGGLLLIILTFLILKSLFIKNIDLYSLVIMWISLGFIHLMVSSSYLIDIKFWIFIGLITNLLITNKRNADGERFLGVS